MKLSLSRSAAILLAALLAGCQTADSGVEPGASVTRFHLGQPIARGEIRVEPAEAARADSLEFAQHAAAVERELGLPLAEVFSTFDPQPLGSGSLGHRIVTCGGARPFRRRDLSAG